MTTQDLQILLHADILRRFHHGFQSDLPHALRDRNAQQNILRHIALRRQCIDRRINAMAHQYISRYRQRDRLHFICQKGAV